MQAAVKAYRAARRMTKWTLRFEISAYDTPILPLRAKTG